MTFPQVMDSDVATITAPDRTCWRIAAPILLPEPRTAPSVASGQEPGFGVAGASALSAGREEGAGLADGHHESTDSWVGLLLRDAPATGCAPRCWPAGTGPGGRPGGCWVHKVVNVLADLTGPPIDITFVIIPAGYGEMG
jgi:hypothetical protein